MTNLDLHYVGPLLSLGDLTYIEQTQLSATIFPEDDIDRYVFYVEERTWVWFEVEVVLSNVPDGADYFLELYFIRDQNDENQGLVESANDGGEGEGETLKYSNNLLDNRTGWYEVLVRSYDGVPSCQTAYNLDILVGQTLL